MVFTMATVCLKQTPCFEIEKEMEMNSPLAVSSYEQGSSLAHVNLCNNLILII